MTSDEELLRDASGRVLATYGLDVAPPWVVTPSAKYEGRYYFLNAVSYEAAWSLDLAVIKYPKTEKREHPGVGSHAKPMGTSLDSVTDGSDPHRSPQPRRAEEFFSVPQAVGAASRRRSTTASPADNSESSPSKRNFESSPSPEVSAICFDLPAPSNNNPSVRTSCSSVPSALKDALKEGRPPVEVVSGLGQGGYATVVLVKVVVRASVSKLFAMKVISKEKHSRSKDRKRLVTELKVMRETPPSRFLERCKIAFESATDVMFVCDYIGGGDLFYHMACRMAQGKWGFEEHECKIMLAEVTLGIEHLHSSGFIHRDLKIENIMLDASGHVKLIDFGLAAEISGSEQTLSSTGSLSYMAPELIKSKKGGRHTDWWALGILAFELLTGRTPWSTISDRPLIRYEIQNCQVLPPDSVSPAAGQFVVSLLKADHRLRLGTRCTNDVKKAPFFQGINWSAMNLGLTDAAFVCGPAAVRPEDGRSALEAYVRRAERNAPRSSGVVGKFGVKSPWFLGLAVVTNNPPLATSGP